MGESESIYRYLSIYQEDSLNMSMVHSKLNVISPSGSVIPYMLLLHTVLGIVAFSNTVIAITLFVPPVTSGASFLSTTKTVITRFCKPL